MDTIITRYMSFPKFVSFLKDGLFMPSAMLFEDSWEGLLPIKLMRKDAVHSYVETFQSMAQWIYLSCWHKEECENYSMWKIYGQVSEAVAIETTKEKLKSAYLNDFNDSLAYLDEINYILIENSNNFTVPSIRPLSKRPSQIRGGELYPHLLFFFLKDRGFEFEHEVRLVALDKSFRSGMSNSKNGIYVNFRAVDSFIQKIRLSPTAPDWFDGVVSDLLKKYGVETEIEHSRFFEQPPTITHLS